jgi:hypothetical protein
MYTFVKLLNYIIIFPFIHIAVRGNILFSELTYVKGDMSMSYGNQ